MVKDSPAFIMHRSRMQHMLHSEYIYSEYFNCITLITLTYFYFLHAVGQQLTISFSSDRLVVWSLKSCFVCKSKISSCTEETRKYPHFRSREFSFQSILRIVGDQCDSWELVAALDAGLLLECSHRSFFFTPVKDPNTSSTSGVMRLQSHKLALGTNSWQI